MVIRDSRSEGVCLRQTVTFGRARMSASQLLISGIAERGHHRRALSSILLKSGKVKGVLYLGRRENATSDERSRAVSRGD